MTLFQSILRQYNGATLHKSFGVNRSFPLKRPLGQPGLGYFYDLGVFAYTADPVHECASRRGQLVEYWHLGRIPPAQ
jgi:hypothetical protein